MTQRLRDRARRRAGAFAVDGLFKGASAVGRWLPAARPAIHGVEVIRDVPYVASGDRMHLLDVYRPVRPPPGFVRGGRLPAIVYLHGGGFRMLDKDSHWLPGLIYARRGYVVFVVSYRLAPAHPFPAAIEDAAQVLGWLAANGERYGADLDRVGFAGESAGGNLVASLTLCTTFRRPESFARAAFDTGIVPKAAMPAMGFFQVSDPGRFGLKSAFMRDRIEEVQHAYLPDGVSRDLADPLLVLERDDAPERPLPPFHAFCGTADPLIDDTRRLASALERRGVRHEVSYWEGGVHAFHMFVFVSQAREAWAEVLAFAQREVAGVDAPLRPMPWARPVP
ncbi:MAG: alpha/beta hydrolase [Myxococcota bacterium]